MKAIACIVIISFTSISALSGSHFRRNPAIPKTVQASTTATAAPWWSNPGIWVLGAVAVLTIFKLWQQKTPEEQGSISLRGLSQKMPGATQAQNNLHRNPNSQEDWQDAGTESDND